MNNVGMMFTGATAGDFAGYAVGCGDVDGDTGVDLIIGAIDADPSSRTEAGSVYVYYGGNRFVTNDNCSCDSKVFVCRRACAG